MPIVKTITYENLEKEHKENPKILPFKYIKPFKQEIEEIEEKRGDLASGENDRVRFLLKKQEVEGLSKKEKIELRELIKTISASAPEEAPFMFEDFLQEKQNGFKGTYQDYLDEIDRSPWDYVKKKEGIMQVASVEDDMDREFYGRLLSPLYRPDYLESLPINKLKELFDEYLRNMGIS